MFAKRLIYIGLSLLIGMLALTSTSCKSRKAGCEANGTYQSKKHKKNKSGYGTRYSYKTKAVRKAYVIRNK